jgi:ribonuclease D
MQYIQTESELAATVRALETESLLAVDTEAAGYHRYADHICLVQLSTYEATYVVDALAVDIAAFGPVFSDPGREILLHDADYDLRLFTRDHSLGVSRLFDTKIAAQMLGEPSIGLASLVEKHVGVRLDKKYQRADWAKRPLPADMLEYAADDTRHLPALRDRLREALSAAERLHWAEEEFALRAEAEFEIRPDETAFLRLKNTRGLGPRQLGALRELYDWRDRLARERDVAPFRVLSNDQLVRIARRMPDSIRDLRSGDFDAATVRHAGELFEAVQRARRLPEGELPTRKRGPRRPPPDPAFEARVDRVKAVRDRIADELGMDRGFLMPRQQLEDIARAVPGSADELVAVRDVRRWQLEALGDALLEALRRKD